MPAPDLRASDADRDRVIDVLRAATADGRLTADEFNERMEAALASRTFRELAPLTADLAAAAPAQQIPETAQGEDVIRIDQRGGSVQRIGRWVVPRLLELHPSWCDVNLNFTGAVIMHDTLHVDMKMRGGSLILVTGPGVVVDADSLMTRYTDISIHPPTEPDTPVRLRIHLVGRMRYGYIEAR
ncbi:MAG: DUF1707 SHOCT-like domain-containing protein [Streptosporangiaceae bacterium]